MHRGEWRAGYPTDGHARATRQPSSAKRCEAQGQHRGALYMAPKKSGYLGIQTMPFVATSQFQGPPRSRAPCTFSQPPTQDIWQSQSPQPLPQQFRHCAERHGPSICVVRVADGAFVRKFDIWTSANRLAYAHTFHIFHSMTHSRHWLFPDTRAPRQATATIQHHSTVRVWCDAARAARRRRMAPLQCALTMQLSISLKRARRGAHCKHNLDICLSANCLRRARKLDFLSSANHLQDRDTHPTTSKVNPLCHFRCRGRRQAISTIRCTSTGRAWYAATRAARRRRTDPWSALSMPALSCVHASIFPFTKRAWRGARSKRKLDIV